MSLLPPSHNDSFQRLLDEGFTLYRHGAFIVGRVPFLDANLTVQHGLLIDAISEEAGGVAGQSPFLHQFLFSGGTPSNIDGTQLVLGGGPDNRLIFDNVNADWFWSFKKTENGQARDYVDFYEKFRHHFDAITAPVRHLYPDVELKPFVNVLSVEDDNNPFVFNDEHSARAAVMDLRENLLAHRVGVIGVGGTGSFIVDLLSKSPVNKIVVFDPDILKVHNTFRSPGPAIREDLGRPKAELLAHRYLRSHKRVEHHNVAVSPANAELLEGLTFVFVCVDKEGVRRELATLLLEKDIPFIDTGMGLDRSAAGLTGMVRTTLSRPESRPMIEAEFTTPAHEVAENIYHTNIQTADLNALNAATAVMMFKKYAGYYAEMPQTWQSLLTVQTGSTIRYPC
ncbi:DUF6791 domain-containing protein [Sphingomonas alba]|uniref:ThiF family adenylyltransferase n=1 Tax=Sphingomonas alba TaxID=2908208 RepID=A0ABT0RIM6_9SPHN|nr:DUF6791 domain-containing protein [Sphingomonas alba]MCL6682482.1 ThiF family adenylyltransferase [Sphingomonas alba]